MSAAFVEPEARANLMRRTREGRRDIAVADCVSRYQIVRTFQSGLRRARL
jgi:hypothetical protein